MNNQTWITRLFNYLLLASITILVFMSALALIVVHLTFFDLKKYQFSFNPIGINNYLTALGEYKALFTATVATIAAYYGLWRFQVAADQNRDKLRQDRFTEWRAVLEIRLTEMERHNPFLRREFTRVRLNLFNQLFDLNFSIENNQQLTTLFQNTFEGIVDFLETQNNRHISMGGIYGNNTYSYSYDSFRFIFLGCPDHIYPNAEADLRNLYLAAMDQNRIINETMYQAALLNYRP